MGRAKPLSQKLERMQLTAINKSGFAERKTLEPTYGTRKYIDRKRKLSSQSTARCSKVTPRLGDVCCKGFTKLYSGARRTAKTVVQERGGRREAPRAMKTARHGQSARSTHADKPSQKTVFHDATERVSVPFFEDITEGMQESSNKQHDATEPALVIFFAPT
eukprot:3106627-Pleurochrysis_carterae.AAC.1